MFFDEKSRVFRRLKNILRDLQKAESDIKRKDFEDVFKELRLGFLENQKLISWLRKHHSAKIDSKDLTYGSEHLDKLFSKVTAMLMDIKEHFFNQKDYSAALALIQEMENLVIWEIKADRRFTKQNIEVIQLSQDEILKKVKEVDRQLVRIIEEYGLDDPVNFIKITNKDSEKLKFIEFFNKGIVYNPKFSYKPIPENVLSKAQNQAEDVMKQLKKLNLTLTKGAVYLVEKKRVNLQIILKLIRSIGTNKITKYSTQLYSFPSNDLVKEAYAELDAGKRAIGQQLDAKLDEKRYSVKDFKKKANEFFKENNMDWKTIIKTSNDMDGRFKTVNTKTEFWVNKDFAPFSERDIIKAIEHEIKVHAFRLESGKKSPLKILAYGTSGYLPTEEGLTTYFEDLKNATNPILQKKKILYVITEFLAAKGGFYHCFASLTEYGIEPKIAWEVVVRIKRGLNNTGQSGGLFKDHVYFLGDKLLREFISSGGRAEDLLGGKIGLEDIKHLIDEYRL